MSCCSSSVGSHSGTYGMLTLGWFIVSLSHAVFVRWDNMTSIIFILGSFYYFNNADLDCN